MHSSLKQAGSLKAVLVAKSRKPRFDTIRGYKYSHITEQEAGDVDETASDP